MLPGEYRAVIDPFSEEAREILKSVPLESLPADVVEMAVKRVGWSGREGMIEANIDAIKADVLSFHLMCMGIASVSHPYSREVALASEATRNVIRYRVSKLFGMGEEKFCIETMAKYLNLIDVEKGEKYRVGDAEIPDADVFRIRDKRMEKDGKEVDPAFLSWYFPRYAVRWTDLAPIMRRGKIDLTDLYLMNGWAVLTTRDLWDVYADFISVKTEEHIQSIYEKIQPAGEGGSAGESLFIEVGGRISALVPKTSSVGGWWAGAGKLRPEFFPPCILATLEGVGSGMRNFAITMLLTTFLSYARVAPSGKVVTKMADFIDDISVVTEEIAPIIFQAAERCNPPLFKDQPQEKANVFYHMGFGMTTAPKLSDSGKSKWYRVPNCSKIQMSTPTLCRPDELCRRVKNPLTYYFRKKAESFRRGSQTSGVGD
ncbi:MAG: hypothetical protein QXT22_01295 [Candidatus Hadarchaeales archaeon]